MDEERSLLPWIIFLSVLAVVAIGLVMYFRSPPSDRQAVAMGHPLAGKWRNGDLGILIIYDDHWASANGIKCPWESAGGSAIRIELDLDKISASFPSLTVMADFRLRPDGVGRQAVLNLIGKDLVFERMDAGAPGGIAARP